MYLSLTHADIENLTKDVLVSAKSAQASNSPCHQKEVHIKSLLRKFQNFWQMEIGVIGHKKVLCIFFYSILLSAATVAYSSSCILQDSSLISPNLIIFYSNK